MATMLPSPTVADLGSRKTPKVNRFAVGATLLGLSIIFAIFWALGISLQEFRDVLARMPLWLYAVLALTNGGTVLAGSIKWQTVVSSLSKGTGRVPLFSAVLATSVGVFVGQILPIQLATAASRAMIGKRERISPLFSLGATAYEQVLDLIVLGAFALVCAGSAIFRVHWTLAIIVSILLTAVLVASVTFAISLAQRFVALAAGRIPGRLTNLVRALETALQMSQRLQRRTVIWITALSVARYVLMLIGTMLIVGTLIPTSDPLQVFLIFPIVQLTTSLPITPAGLGVAEITWMGLFTAAGVGVKEAAIAAAAIRIANLFGFAIFFSILGLLSLRPFSRRLLRSEVAEGNTDPKSESAATLQARKPDRLSALLVYDCIYPDSIGGVEHRNHQIAEQLFQRGHRAVLAGWRNEGGSNGQPVLDMRFRTKIYGASGKRSPIASFKFAAACLFLPIRQFDVIETANIPYMHIVPLAIRCRLAGTPLVITWHEYWGAYWRSYVGPARAPVFAAIEWVTAQLGSAVTAVSSLTANRVRAHRLGSRDVPIIPCGIPLDRIRSAAAGAKRERATLIYAGRLMLEKRIDLAIASLRCTTRSSPILKIIGDGPDRSRLEALVRELGLNDRVRFLGRLASPDEVWREIACARVAVQPSSREGFGMFPLEALACGTPVICCESSESAVTDLIGDGERGYCAQATPDSLAERIDTLVESDDIWERMSMDAIRFAQAYRWETIGENVELLFSRVINRKTNNPPATRDL